MAAPPLRLALMAAMAVVLIAAAWVMPAPQQPDMPGMAMATSAIMQHNDACCPAAANPAAAHCAGCLAAVLDTPAPPPEPRATREPYAATAQRAVPAPDPAVPHGPPRFS